MPVVDGRHRTRHQMWCLARASSQRRRPLPSLEQPLKRPCALPQATSEEAAFRASGCARSCRRSRVVGHAS
jgi:hypothetical protein